MSLSKDKRDAVADFILKNVSAHPSDIVKVTVEKFSLSRQTINKYLDKLVADGQLTVEGKGRGKQYTSLVTVYKLPAINIVPELDEATIWTNEIKPLLPPLQDNIMKICQYGFTEMLNNVIDHSESKSVHITIEYNYSYVRFEILDKGVGIFSKIQKWLSLDDKRYAIIELAKGKFTTDPSRHSGEGIFFTSKMFDVYGIISDGLIFNSGAIFTSDYIIEDKHPNEGTVVVLYIELDVDRSVEKVFDKFAPDKPGDYGFKKTIIEVRLLEREGESLVSRSQAKRLMARLDKFTSVVLDLKGIDFIGQAFADEVFRVYKNAHPEINLTHENASERVEAMIRHVQAA